MGSVAGKVAAVTGAGSGIGRALAAELARRGCRLALSDVDAEGLAGTAARVGSAPACSTDVVDVRDAAAVERWAGAVVESHGGVDLVFNNAGVALTGRIGEVSLDEIRWVMDVNFWGVVHGTKTFLPLLEARGGGHIVNVSSVFGLIAMPGNGAYNASKFAVRGFTECLREELELDGSPVSVTSVHPGGIRTAIAARARRSAGDRSGIDRQTMVAEFEELAKVTPQAAARKILAAVDAGRRRLLIGRDAWLIDKIQRLFPAGYQRWVVRQARKRPGLV